MNYEAERAIAKAATPGPREVVYDPDDDHDSGRRCPSWWVKFKDAPPQMLYGDSTLMREADAIHFATFNPEFCLGLLDMAEKAERYERALLLIAPWGDGYDGAIARKALNPTESS